MKYVDPGQYLLSPTASNEEQIQEDTIKHGFSKVIAALSGRKHAQTRDASGASGSNPSDESRRPSGSLQQQQEHQYLEHLQRIQRHLEQQLQQGRDVADADAGAAPPPGGLHLQHSDFIDLGRHSPPSPQRPQSDGTTETENDDDDAMDTDSDGELEIEVARSVSRSPSPSSDFSPLLSLPLEILHRIIELVYYDDNTASISSNLETFSQTMPLLSRTINSLSLRFLYKYAIFNRPHAFDKFLHNVISNPGIGNYVEFMDFQQFTSIGLGRTGRMNQEIQMVTSDTIFTALSLTPNLLEFLSSENIQDDMDVRVLDCLFNGLRQLQAMDFCGASSESFARAFSELEIASADAEAAAQSSSSLSLSSSAALDMSASSATLTRHHTAAAPPPPLSRLFKLSFHDCSNLAPDVYAKVLPHLANLRRLDLNHTSVTSALLNACMPASARLTHLSLARCSKLTTRDLIQFLTQHPSVARGSLQWLSLQTDSNVVSPLSDTYLSFTLRNLNAPALRYLNLGGLPVNASHLQQIRARFPGLETLAISHSPSVTIDDIDGFLKDNKTIKFVDLTGCKRITRFNIPVILRNCFYTADSLVALEFDYKILMELTGSGNHLKITPNSKSFLDPPVAPQVWKFYDNEGRRSWIYKVEPSDPYYKSVINSTGNITRTSSISNLTYYDLETGKKITQKFRKPDFLKYVSRKICCSVGYHRLDDTKKKSYIEGTLAEDVWPAEFSQRGIYNYYSLNVK